MEKLVITNPVFGKYLTPKRINIITTLLKEGEVSQKELAEMLGMNESTLSYHISILESLGVVTRERTITKQGGKFKKVNIVKYNPDNEVVELNLTPP